VITSKSKSERDWEERQQMVDRKVRQLKEGHRENNILIFGFEERRDKGYFDSRGVMMMFLRERVKLEVLNGSINCVTRLGKRRGA
jgi:hypothetical protein